MEPVKIVVRYLDGRLLKGFTHDFLPNKASFHLQSQTGGASEKPVEVKMEDLKAVFFVKSFEGNPNFKEKKAFAEGDRPQGRKVELTFVDGEVMQGATLGYNPQRIGFFLFPPDPEGNNIRIFVLSAAVREFRYL